MAFARVDNQKGEQVEPTMHSNPYFDERDDDQSSVTVEECYNLFDEECCKPVADPVCGGFEEYLTPPIYYEYEGGYLEDEGPK